MITWLWKWWLWHKPWKILLLFLGGGEMNIIKSAFGQSFSNNICMENGYYLSGVFSDNWFFYDWYHNIKFTQINVVFFKRVPINIETSLCIIGIITLNSQYNHISVVIKEVVIRSSFCKHFNDQKLQSYIHHSRATECLQSNSVVQIMHFFLVD